jgi:hypothetical protein
MGAGAGAENTGFTGAMGWGAGGMGIAPPVGGIMGAPPGRGGMGIAPVGGIIGAPPAGGGTGGMPIGWPGMGGRPG